MTDRQITEALKKERKGRGYVTQEKHRKLLAENDALSARMIFAKGQIEKLTEERNAARLEYLTVQEQLDDMREDCTFNRERARINAEIARLYAKRLDDVEKRAKR